MSILQPIKVEITSGGFFWVHKIFLEDYCTPPSQRTVSWILRPEMFWENHLSQKYHPPILWKEKSDHNTWNILYNHVKPNKISKTGICKFRSHSFIPDLVHQKQFWSWCRSTPTAAGGTSERASSQQSGQWPVSQFTLQTVMWSVVDEYIGILLSNLSSIPDTCFGFWQGLSRWWPTKLENKQLQTVPGRYR